MSFGLGVGNNDVVRLRAPSNKERVDWIAVLSKARREAVDARRDAVAAMGGRPVSVSSDPRRPASVRSRSDSLQPRESWEHRRPVSGYGGYEDPQRRPSSAYGYEAPSGPPVQAAQRPRPVSTYEFRPELDRPPQRTRTPPPPARSPPPRSGPDYVTSYPGQRVYDEAHSYAGKGENMYNHEF